MSRQVTDTQIQGTEAESISLKISTLTLAVVTPLLPCTWVFTLSSAPSLQLPNLLLVSMPEPGELFCETPAAVTSLVQGSAHHWVSLCSSGMLRALFGFCIGLPTTFNAWAARSAELGHTFLVTDYTPNPSGPERLTSPITSQLLPPRL